MKLKMFEPHIKLELLSFTLASATPFITCNYMLYFFLFMFYFESPEVSSTDPLKALVL